MFKRISLITIISLGFSGCSAPGVKPEDANLIEAAVNISSGEFDNQLSRKQFKLKNSQDALSSETEKNKKLNQQLLSLSAQKQALDRQLVVLQGENTRLTQQANKTRAATNVQQGQRDRQISKIKLLNSSITKLKRNRASVKGNEVYKSQIINLNQEIQVLRKMISNQ